MSTSSISIFWFRRDLRLEDNAALYHALKSGLPVLAIFIFDTAILKKLENKTDPRVGFIHATLTQLQSDLQKLGSSLMVLHRTVLDTFKQITTTFEISAVYTNHDYEPYATKRDEEVDSFLKSKNINFLTFKDQVIFEKKEVMSDTGNPYKVYTPYKNKWLQKLSPFYLKPYPTEKYFNNFLKDMSFPLPSLESIGFVRSQIQIPTKSIRTAILKEYDTRRNFPEQAATSLLGIHLRFGTVSIREIARIAQDTNAVWLSEFIWREFFMQLMFHFPYVVHEPFQRKYAHLAWRYDEKDFQLWCTGNTGYPLVDAGMRELNATGHMHNRVRMVVASFLTKHLLIDWRWGEAYFAARLLDFDLSANNGNWQWSAGTGADAQPFFRIFNPTLQQERFDPKYAYIKKWVPEYGTFSYVSPMIDHKFATERAKAAFKKMGLETE